MLPLDEAPAEEGPFDRLIDLPPYVRRGDPSLDAPHLRLALDGRPVTSVGLVVRAAGGG